MGLIPRFAEPIIEARKAGKKPAAVVVVSDGQLGLHARFPKNPVVLLDKKKSPREYFFRFLADLHVEVATVANEKRTLELAAALLAIRPRTLRFWFLDIDKVIGIRWEVWPGRSLVDVEEVQPWHYDLREQA